MKCTVFQLVTVMLMFCVLSAGCSSPTDAKIKPLETTVSTPPPITTSTSTAPANFKGRIFYIIKNKGIRRSELNTAYRKSGAELIHDLKYFLGIGFVVFVEVIIIWWEISEIITVFSS